MDWKTFFAVIFVTFMLDNMFDTYIAAKYYKRDINNLNN